MFLFVNNITNINNKMEAEVAMMVRKGEVDEALVLLIEANTQQASIALGPSSKVVVR